MPVLKHGGETIIQLATQDDEVHVRALISQAIRNTPQYSQSVVEAELGYNNADSITDMINDGLCLVAVLNDNVVGTVIGQHENGMIYLSWVAVMPKSQQLGIGEKLIAAFCESVRDKGHKIICNTVVGNDASFGLFTKMGFRNVVKLEHHWHDLDFYLWERRLEEGHYISMFDRLKGIKILDDRFVQEMTELQQGLADGSIRITITREGKANEAQTTA